MNAVIPKSAATGGQLEVYVKSVLHGRVSDLHVSLRDGGVILKGHAHTFYAKQVAQHAVMQATRLPLLRNEIEVY